MIGTFYLKTAYSMLDSTIRLEELFDHAKKSNYDFLAITDYKLHGLHKSLNLAKNYDFKFIAGLIVLTKVLELELELLVYAKNKQGLNDLIALSTYLETNQSPIEITKLVEFSSNFIVATSGANTILEELILAEDLRVYDIVAKLKENFNEFYLGLSLQTFSLEMKLAPMLVKIAQYYKLSLIPMHHTTYLNKDDKQVYLAIKQIGGTKVNNDFDYSFYSAGELKHEYYDYSFVFENAKQIINKIDYKDFKQHFILPKFPTKNNATASEYLTALAKLGLKKRLAGSSENISIYQQRLDYELNVIFDMGYCDYFLIVYDFVKYAKENKILVGPGRGSAAGSLVSYCLGITEVDPIKYNLLFERFLNPQRKSMPDIDLDFPDNRRDEVINYVKDKYGASRVVTITTFSTFAIRSSIRDISKVLDIAPTRINSIINRIINDKIDQSDEQTVELLTMAKKIEGLPRQTGTHAAGIILSNDRLEDKIPLQKGPHQMLQSQYEASDLEQLGLLKIDFLGIRNLTIIDEVLKRIDTKIQINKLPLDDPIVYQLLSSGETTGIFQLESAGMRQAIKKVKPTCFEDLVALLALYRPGPMDSINDYVSRKNGDEKVEIIKELEEILSPTYGIIIYQEQIMSIAATFAGYTLAEADLLRRGISKKDKQILEAEEINFIAKATALGKDHNLAKQIYQHIVKFADYGFNRSHSVAYGMVAYQMAYLKAHYFETFMSVLASNVISNDSLLKDYLKEIKQHKIKFLKPDISYSSSEFMVNKEGIMLPLLMIKGIGFQTVLKLSEEQKKGPFKSYDDFKMRIKDILNEKNIVSLIYASALDGFGYNKQTLYHNRSLEGLGFQQYIEDYQMPIYPEHDLGELAKLEEMSFGFNVFYQLSDLYSEEKKKRKLVDIAEQLDNEQISFLGVIEKIKVIKTSKNEPMAFISVNDFTTSIEITIFPRTYAKYLKLLDGKVFIFKVLKNKGYILNELEKIG